MKAKLTILLFLIGFKFSLAGTSGAEGVNRTSVINSNDTVVFDLGQTGFSGMVIDFPVYIATDDTVNALDFSLRYNEQQFLFDTITNLTPGLQVMSYYNAADSTLRFTSNSLHQISTGVPLINVRFRLLSGQFCNINLSDVNVYLNGDLCTARIVNCTVNSTQDLQNSIQYLVYPNPSADNVIVKADNRGQFTASLFNSIGQQLEISSLENEEGLSIDVKSLPTGMYVLAIDTGKGVEKRIISVVH